MVSPRRACVARVTIVGFACLCFGRLMSKHLTSRMSNYAINRLMKIMHTCGIRTSKVKRL